MREWGNRYLYVLVPVILVAAVFLGLWWYADLTAADVEEQTYGSLLESAAEQRTTLQAKLDGLYFALEGCAAHLAGADPQQDQEHIVSTLDDFTQVGAFYNICLADESGDTIANSGALTYVGDRDYFALSLQGQRAIVRVKSGRLLQGPSIVLSVPVWLDGQVTGVLLGILELERFSRLLNENNSNAVFSFVCDSRGDIIIGPLDESIPIYGEENVLAYLDRCELDESMTMDGLSRALAAGDPVTVSCHCQDGDSYATFLPLDLNDWYIVNVAPAALVEARSIELSRRFSPPMALVIGACLLLVMFIFIWERNLSRSRAEEHERLRRSEEMYRCVEEMSDNVLFEGDTMANTLHFNKKFSQMFGGGPGINRLSEFGSSLDPYIYQEDQPIWSQLGRSMHSGRPSGQAELRFRHANGQPIWCRVEYVYLYGISGHPYRVVGKISNIDVHKRLLTKLQDEAQSDSLTGLLNHASFFMQAEAFLQGPGAGGGHGLLILDVDDFKRINDTLGHYVGDQALQQVAQRLKQLFRSTDMLCRLGGDEFAVLVKEISGSSILEDKAREIVRTIRSDLENGEQRLSLSVSVGGSFFDRQGSIQDLYRSADQALYDAKDQGKNRYVIYGADPA